VNINDYLEKLRQKPEKQRERIAIGATAAAFLIVLVIWLVSFSENSKPPADQSTSGVSDQLQNLKDSFGQDKQSIQDMMQNLPQQGDLTGNSVSGDTGAGAADQSSNSDQSAPDQNAAPDNSLGDQSVGQDIPSLPGANQDSSSSRPPTSPDQKNNTPDIPSLP